jgi:nucleotide-binding universal stress UspA family protein
MYQRILVPVDGSAASDRGLDEAIRLAQVTGSHLRLVHVMDRLTLTTGLDAYLASNFDVMPPMKEAAEKILAEGSRRVETAGGIPFDTALMDNQASPVAERIEACAKEWQADLVVIGTHG